MAVKEWLENLDSEEPLERIIARINLLREFPSHTQQDLKSRMFFALSKDVSRNTTPTMDYIFSLEDVNELAHAIWTTDFGFSPYYADSEEVKEERHRMRAEFLGRVEGFADRLPEVEDVHPKTDIAQIIAREGSLTRALAAVDLLWSIGWDTYLHKSVYEDYRSNYVVDHLETIAESAKETEVRKKALNLIGEIPDEQKRNEYLQNIITSKDTEMAIAAVDLYIEKNDSGIGKTKSRAAVDALISRQQGLGGGTRSAAKQPTVEYAFDKVIELTPEHERVEQAYEFLTDGFTSWMSCRKQPYPPGLIAKAMGYLADNIDKIPEVKDKSKKEKILFTLACRGNEKALDLLAEGPDGVLNVAQMYTDFRNFRLSLSQKMRDRVKFWALKYTRKFAELEDKELARFALRMIGGNPDQDWYGDGMIYQDEESGRDLDEVAREELAKLPKAPTEKDKLAETFGVGEAKP